jgi:hypothetical protein
MTLFPLPPATADASSSAFIRVHRRFTTNHLRLTCGFEQSEEDLTNGGKSPKLRGQCNSLDMLASSWSVWP